MPDWNYITNEMKRSFGDVFAEYKDIYELWYRTDNPKMMLKLLWLIDHRQRFELYGNYAYFDEFRALAEWIYEKRKSHDSDLPSFEDAIEETRFNSELYEGRLDERSYKQAIYTAIQGSVESYLLRMKDEEAKSISDKFRELIPSPFIDVRNAKQV
jgi:hypothetical protein